MRIETLALTNIGGFTNATFTFRPGANVIVGINGSGKSTLMDSIYAVCVHVGTHALMQELEPKEPKNIFYPTWSPPASLVNQHAEWGSIAASVQRGDARAITQLNIPKNPMAISSNIGGSFPQTDQELPRCLCINFDAGRTRAARHTTATKDSEVRQHKFHQQLADAAASEYESNFAAFAQWFRLREDLENQERVDREDLRFEDRGLTAVRRAMHQTLPEFDRIRVQRKPGNVSHLTVEKNKERLLFEQLSDGERTILCLVGEIAYRLSIVHDQLTDPLLGPAIVLIDEIELHLHPGLQRMLLPRLTAAFPNIQFIATTHSPQVVASVASEAVIVLDGFVPYRAGPTEGKDSNALLETVFHVHARPDAQHQAFAAVEALIDRSEYAQAREALDAIAKTVTDEDHDVIRLRTMLQVLEAGE